MTALLMPADDNGNAFGMARVESQEEAEAAALSFELRCHKQVYWVTEPGSRALFSTAASGKRS